MKLFYASGTSAMAPHILLEESGLPYSLEQVNLDKKTWQQGDYRLINPKSYVPTLETDHGTYLTECAVILEYLSTQVHNKYTFDYQSNEYWQERVWLNYIATELHKNFISPFRTGNWLPNTPESKNLVWQRVQPRLAYVETDLNQKWLLGNQLTAADMYLFVMTNWMQRLAFPFNDFPRLADFDHRMRQLTSAQTVLKMEGRPHSLTD